MREDDGCRGGCGIMTAAVVVVIVAITWLAIVIFGALIISIVR